MYSRKIGGVNAPLEAYTSHTEVLSVHQLCNFVYTLSSTCLLHFNTLKPTDGLCIFMCGNTDIQAKGDCRDFFPLRLLWQLHCIVSTGSYIYWENLKITNMHTHRHIHQNTVHFRDNLTSQCYFNICRFYLTHEVLNSALHWWINGWHCGVEGSVAA